MDSVGNAFSNHMDSIAKTAKEMESDKKNQVGTIAIDYLVAQLAKEMKSNKELCTLENKDFANALDSVTHLVAGSSASTSAQNKLEKIYLKLHPPETPKVDKKIEGFLRILNREVPSNAFGTNAATLNMKDTLKDPENLLLFLKYSNETLRKEVLVSCGIDIGAKLPEGDTLLHRACEQETPSKLITLLLQLGANVDEKDKYGETPLIRAINDDNLSAVKALVQSGAKIDLEGKKINSRTIEPEITKYLEKQVLKAMTTQLSKVDQDVLNPPNKPGSVGLIGGTGGQNVAKFARQIGTPLGLGDAFGFVGEITLPLLKGRDFLMEASKAKESHEPLRNVIKEKRQEITKLEEQITNAKGPTKDKLIQEKKQLAEDLKQIREIGGRKETHIQLEVLKKGVEYLKHDPTVGSLASVLAPKQSLVKALSQTAGVLTSSVTVYQNWNALTDNETKQNHLMRISTALQSTKSELEQLSKQLDSKSMEGLIVKLKINDINQKLAHVEKEKDTLKSQGNWIRGAIALSTVSMGLLAYGTMMYLSQTQENAPFAGETLAQKAPLLSTMGGTLPMIGPHLSAGFGWLYEKGAALYKGTPPTVAETSMREEKALNNELNEINEQLQSGTTGLGWVEPPPKKGSKLHTQLTLRKQEIDNELLFYEGSKKLGMTPSEFKSDVLAITKQSERLKSIVDESGVNALNFEKHPIPAIIQYLTR